MERIARSGCILVFQIASRISMIIIKTSLLKTQDQTAQRMWRVLWNTVIWSLTTNATYSAYTLMTRANKPFMRKKQDTAIYK